MNNRLYGNLIFELSCEGRKGYSLPKNAFGDYEIPVALCRKEDAALPECDELTVVRHYTNLSANNFGVDNGFYPYLTKFNNARQSTPLQINSHEELIAWVEYVEFNNITSKQITVNKC